MTGMPTTKLARAARVEPRVSDREYEMLASFRHTLRRFLSFSEEAARVVGLTPQQHQAMLAIKGFQGREELTIGDLAEALCRYTVPVGDLTEPGDDDMACQVCLLAYGRLARTTSIDEGEETR